jgi:hypothetical protein
MQQFISGNDTQFNWLRSQIQEALYIFNNTQLPATCSPNVARIGFEYTAANGYKMYIDRGITFTGSHTGFSNLVANGEVSFGSYEAMTAFIRGLGSIYNAPARPIVPSYTPPRQASNGQTLDYTATSARGNRYNFRFEYRQVGSVWRAYIISSPSYGSRSTGAHDTHRLNDGRYYVCWTPEPTRLDQVTEVSKLWAKATANYIDGGSFAP